MYLSLKALYLMRWNLEDGKDLSRNETMLFERYLRQDYNFGKNIFTVGLNEKK
jgi:hypothetical protein